MCSTAEAKKMASSNSLHVASIWRYIVCFPVESCGTNFENIRSSCHCFLHRKLLRWKSTAHFKDDQFLSFSKMSYKRTRNILWFWLMFFFLGLVKRIVSWNFIHPSRHFLRLSHNDQPWKKVRKLVWRYYWSLVNFEEYKTSRT